MNNKLLLFKYAGTLLIDQIISVLCSLVLITVLGFFFKSSGNFLQSILGFIFFAWIIYFDAWQKGASDINKIKLGYIRKNCFKGFLAGVLATIPNLIFAVFAFLSEGGSFKAAEFIGVDVTTAIFRFWNLPLGLFLNLANKNPYYNFLMPAFLPVISGIGYLFGLNRFSLKQVIIYKDSEE